MKKNKPAKEINFRAVCFIDELKGLFFFIKIFNSANVLGFLTLTAWIIIFIRF